WRHRFDADVAEPGHDEQDLRLSLSDLGGTVNNISKKIALTVGKEDLGGGVSFMCNTEKM
ncbi:MAG: hypothetical protein IKP73_00550, partial [Bacteroidales bacterium]|nr:hypothetical protein [Bacteroidales bacterium]